MTAQLSDIQAGSVDRFQITSNDSAAESKDLSPVVSEFRYYENILSNNITATAVISETGFETDGTIDNATVASLLTANTRLALVGSYTAA